MARKAIVRVQPRLSSKSDNSSLFRVAAAALRNRDWCTLSELFAAPNLRALFFKLLHEPEHPHDIPARFAERRYSPVPVNRARTGIVGCNHSLQRIAALLISRHQA